MGEARTEQHIEFIIAQQARFSADMDRLESTVETHSTQIAKLTDALLRLADIAEHSDQILALIEHGKETDERLRETDARMNIMIDFLMNQRNGGSNQS